MKKVRFVGLNRDVWIPDHIKVIIDIVPASRRNIRSNQKFTGQKYSTWHDTGNPNSNAQGERNWLHSGAGGASVGYNFAVDANRIYQLTPLDEVTWAAGTAEGNKYSWHMEQCLNTNWDAAFKTCAALQGGLCAAMGWNPDVALVQHNKWYGKHCPAQIRNKGLWPSAVSLTKQYATAARKASTGVPVDPEAPNPTTGHGIPGFDGTKNVTIRGVTYYAQKGKVTLGSSTNVREWANTDAPIIRTAPAGDLQILGWVQGEKVDGIDKWWITDDGRVWSGTTEGEPQVPTPPIPVEPNIVTGKNIYNGRVFYSAGPIATGRPVKVARAGNAYKYADIKAGGAVPVKAGDEFVSRLWCFGDEVEGESTWWLIGTGNEKNPYEECLRLPAAYTTERPE